MKRSSVSTGAAGRQSMQALRSQDFNKQGFYTPQTKERTTFGKLNTNRRTPGTSERKISFFGKRTSGPGSRNSLLGVFGCTEKMKDPRPLNDKAFIQQYIRQLCEFLTENAYAFSVSMKSLQAPSVKDFLKIFTFIFDFLWPSYELPVTKFEEEIPRILKDLGYPFALPKSSMYTVGAPHTWPHMVAGLNWLIDCVKLYFSRKESSPSFDDGQPWGPESEDGIMHNKLFLDYTVKCYENFMTGADSFEDLDTELYSKLKDLFNIDDFQIESLALENKRLNEEITTLERERENEPNRLVSLRKLKTSLKADVQKYQAYMKNLEAHSAVLHQKSSSLNGEVPAQQQQQQSLGLASTGRGSWGGKEGVRGRRVSSSRQGIGIWAEGQAFSLAGAGISTGGAGSHPSLTRGWRWWEGSHEAQIAPPPTPHSHPHPWAAPKVFRKPPLGAKRQRRPRGVAALEAVQMPPSPTKSGASRLAPPLQPSPPPSPLRHNRLRPRPPNPSAVAAAAATVRSPKLTSRGSRREAWASVVSSFPRSLPPKERLGRGSDVRRWGRDSFESVPG
ncbi:kinetochore protein NDC80 homolog [Gracilinanus agilis]|uniref:kinetochore protein NDC80 homolog n=1 Tax=Gracilinanus agilis TaxID=191870 RepID=UPI001CFE686C|nr:kinetochore protein NDC80 homolog [Gracilinanus agilis]